MAASTKTKSSVSKSTIIAINGPQAFAAVEAEIAAVPDADLKQINVDISYAHEAAFAAADRIDELLPQLRQLPFFDLERVLKIRVYAAACRHAHLLATTPETYDPKLVRLLEEGAKLREDLLSTAELLAHFGDVPADRVAAIRTGTGYVDMANDIEQLGVLFEEVWDKVKSRVPVTIAMVKRAPDLAQELHVGLGVKRVGGALVDEAQRTRQRAYTLFVRAYEECRRGVLFLRSAHGDLEDHIPTIYARRRRTAEGKDDGPEGEDPATDPTLRTPTPVVMTPVAPVSLVGSSPTA